MIYMVTIEAQLTQTFKTIMNDKDAKHLLIRNINPYLLICI